jgi:hypothetical protein
MSNGNLGTTLIRTFSIGAVAVMAATGFGARAAIPAGEPTDTATSTGTGENIQVACRWYQRRCVRTPTSVAGVRG